ncbi:hypothetical protein ACPYO6_14575 [Georgenia sp. Z1344]|uniref:hypothetical protein n=1 Tax=Georgenia sp. Z1344 TaxID=3416706 RepID=UPI003CFB6884
MTDRTAGALRATHATRRSMVAAVAALALGVSLGACGPREGGDPTGENGTEESSTGDPGTTSPPDGREAARAEEPIVEAMVREVAAELEPVDAGSVAAAGWVNGATTACSGRSGGPVSWTGRGQMDAADPEEQVLGLADRLGDDWEPVDTSATTARTFQDADGYLLTLAWSVDPDTVTVSVESPCH